MKAFGAYISIAHHYVIVVHTISSNYARFIRINKPSDWRRMYTMKPPEALFKLLGEVSSIEEAMPYLQKNYPELLL